MSDPSSSKLPASSSSSSESKTIENKDDNNNSTNTPGTFVPRVVESVVVHPLVLLSVTDHYNRVARDAQNRRVVGVLLGETWKGRVDVTNSFAVPFEEDPREPGIFYLDHDYLEIMYTMFKKVSAKERIVGFYSTGPKIRPADLPLDKLFRKYTSNPVCVIIDIRPEVQGLPIQSYVTVESIIEGREAVRTFAHIPSEVGAYEAEEVGVEHLLRDINDPSVSSLGADIRHKLNGLQGLFSRLKEISVYLERVLLGKLPPNNEIMYQIQTILALLPNIHIDPLRTSFFEITNDQHLALYTASLARSVIALHDLVTNKAKFKDGENVPEDKENKDKDTSSKEKDGSGKEKDTKKTEKK
jgi:26S proteasome regulatory subunit N8